jgi:hypothetical protein
MFLQENHMNDLIQPQQSPFAMTAQQPRNNPHGGISAGSVAVESERAIAEVHAVILVAQSVPRDWNKIHAEVMSACKSVSFAEVAFYSKPQGNGVVTGPSIRMAEQLKSAINNLDCSVKVLSRTNDQSEVEIMVWDTEKNARWRSVKIIPHARYTRNNGLTKILDPAEINQLINNVASKEKRGLILSAVPKWLIEDAVQECRRTLTGNNKESIDSRVRKMATAFEKYGVKTEHLERYLKHGLNTTMVDELADLRGIFNAIRDGAPPSEFFGAEAIGNDDQPAAVKVIAETAAKNKAAAKPTTKPPVKQADSKPAQTESKPVEDPAPEPVSQPVQADDSGIPEALPLDDEPF